MNGCEYERTEEEQILEPHDERGKWRMTVNLCWKYQTGLDTSRGSHIYDQSRTGSGVM